MESLEPPTIPRERITAEVAVPRQTPSARGETAAVLTVLSGDDPGALFVLDAPVVELGREHGVGLRVDGEGVSRRQARIYRAPTGAITIEDLGSRNGTFVNDVRIHGRVRLAEGDRLHVGSRTVLRFTWMDRLELQAARTRFEMGLRDPLTGLYNRRALDERLEQEMAFADRHQTEVCLILVDLDHFKQINDRFGHPCGDRVLTVVSCALRTCVRTEDLVARYGGEELAVVVRGVDLNGAAALAERLRTGVAAIEVEWGGQPVRVTASLGLAHTDRLRCRTAERLVAAADEALYAAKRAGRDRVCVAALHGREINPGARHRARPHSRVSDGWNK